MDFVDLPLFERWAEERDQLLAQRLALRQQAECGDCTWVEAMDDDAIVVRRLLMDLISAGKIHPSEAEQEFSRLNRGVLNPEPDPTTFDPMREVHWTLVMALAWIMWRCVGDVRRHWDQYRAEKKSWQFNGDYGHSLRSMNPTSYFELRHDELITQPGEGNAPIKSSEVARLELWRSLETGKLIATGIDAQTTKRYEVPAREFIDLNQHESEDGLFMQGAEAAAYLDLRLRSAEIRLLWKSLPRHQTVSAETRCREWLIEKMNNSSEEPNTSKKERYRAACKKFPGVGASENSTPSRPFVRAWAAAIAATGAEWGSSGRKKSKH